MKRNKFSLSNYKLFSSDMGELIPCGWYEVLPGDTIQQATNMLVRASPLLAPVMHPVHARIHHWFVPYRLLWEDFEDFITGGPDGMDASVWPVIESAGTTQGTLRDYLGLPIGSYTPNLFSSAMPWRAYALIWNEWYRDQDLQSEVGFSTAAGTDTTTNQALQNVGWEKDYFTSSRPWAQKGPEVTLPLGTEAPVKGLGFVGAAAISSNVNNVRESDGVTRQYPFANTTFNGAVNGVIAEADSATAATARPTIYADLSNASAVTINTLREALAIQRFEEARARYGSRYTEYLRYLGVSPGDARLQRPEYLGGGKQTIQWSEVLQTGVTTSGNSAGVGTLRGHGIGALRSNRFRRFIPEHGIVMSMFSCKPRTMYMQGLHRFHTRSTKEDLWQRELEMIGQQEVLQQEVYALGSGTRETVFGYQDRYDEYRRLESSVHGEFATSTLNHWHFARSFASAPALNADFVKSVPTDRTFAVPSEDVLYVMANHSIQARRFLQRTGRSMTF